MLCGEGNSVERKRGMLLRRMLPAALVTRAYSIGDRVG